jgi:hypothetical protein
MKKKLRKKVSAALCVAVAAGLGAGCGESADPAPAPAGALPTDVARVLQGACVSCHAATPRYGAPMPLVTYADLQRAAPSNAARRVWQLMGERVHDPVRPMPPTRLAAADLAVIDAWVAAGAPACTGPSCGTVTPPAIDGPALPCVPSHTFSAHAAGSQGAFAVPGAAGNVNKCFAFRSPFNGTTQATAFGPNVNNASVLHHMILFATDTPQTEGAVFNCDGNMPRDARFVTGWAPGNMGTVLPGDVGAELPGNSAWFILQVHYWNVQSAPADDASGLAMCTTDTPRPHAAAVTTLGSADIAIPPRAQDHAVTGTCTPALTEPVHIIGSGPHMHRRGTALRTEIVRGGAAQGQTTMLVDVPNFSFDAQVNYPSDTLVMPGDVLRTTCRFRNMDAQTVYFGERTEDEMCFNFVLAWPAGALSNAGGAVSRRCIDRAM